MSPYLFFFCVFLTINIHLRAQKQGIREWLWALAHPYAAIRVHTITKQCTAIYEVGKNNPNLDAYSAGGKRDAYRHVLYMAAYAQKITSHKLRKLGIAHEKTNYRQFKKGTLEQGELPDSLASVMDLLNNEVGIIIGQTNKSAELHALNTIVLQAISNGDAKIMRRNKSGAYLTCDGKPLNIITQKIWAIEKCLVPSNAAYID